MSSGRIASGADSFSGSMGASWLLRAGNIFVSLDFIGLKTFGLSSVIRISSGLVISLILIPTEFSLVGVLICVVVDGGDVVVVVVVSVNIVLLIVLVLWFTDSAVVVSLDEFSSTFSVND